MAKCDFCEETATVFCFNEQCDNAICGDHEKECENCEESFCESCFSDKKCSECGTSLCNIDGGSDFCLFTRCNKCDNLTCSSHGKLIGVNWICDSCPS